MKFDYRDKGAIATITITSTVFEFRKHNRVVDAALLSADVRAARSGGIHDEVGYIRRITSNVTGIQDGSAREAAR